MDPALPIRTAVVGFGLAGRVFHCPFIAAVPGLELTAVVQRSGDSAHEAYPNARILHTPEEAFRDPAIHLVVVATPNETHFELARAALLAGKHVVVDKPMTTTSADAQTLIELAAQKGKVLAPFHNRRFDTDFLTLSKLIGEAVLGRIVEVGAHFDRFRPRQRPNSWKEAGAANGLLFDLGPHLVDQALALFGPPARLTATVRRDRDKTDIEDFFSIVFEYDLALENGEVRILRYECHASMLSAAPAPRFRVQGTGGSYTKQDLDPQEAALHQGAQPPQIGSQEAWLPEPASAWGTLTLPVDPGNPTLLTSTRYPSVPGDYRLFYANVRDAIRADAPLAIPAEDAYRVLRLLELARESSRQQRTLAVSFDERTRA